MNFRTFAAVKDRRYRRENEVAQPVAGARMSCRLWRIGRGLFPALGHPETVRHHPICGRRAFTCQARAYSHVCRRSRHTAEHGFDAVCGAGDELLEGFRGPRSGGCRQDTRDLLLELRGNGFDIVRTRTDLEAVPAWRRPKLFGIFNNDDLAFANQVGQRGQQPSLSDMVRRAIQLLQYNSGGYLLVVDAGLMGKAAEENNGERTLSQTLELDRAVGIARSYGGEKATIMVCGDVAIGGLNLNGFPFRKDSGIALLGFNSAGQPWITWATGPNGDKSYGAAKIPGKEYENPSKQPQTEQPEPAAFYSKSALVTVEDVVAIGNGPGTDTLQGVLHSTAVFNILRGEL